MESEKQVQADLLRHFLATLKYRVDKALREAPQDFADFNAGKGTRTPHQILAHLSDLLEWAMSIVQKNETWKPQVQSFADDYARFDANLETFDNLLANIAVDHDFNPHRLLQGPFCDAMTHAGQLAMLRRLADSPIKSENFYRAEI